MIKLNNKNITYVALADSSNSLKAPKEIWYADSNNSVKLVYRRKDALIEGEDYEKYHWLKGDDSAYIKGIAFDLWNNHFNARIGKNERLQYFNYYVQSTAANFKIDVDNNVSIPYLLAIFRNAENGVHIDELKPYSAMPDVVDYDFYIDNSTFYCNRDGVIHTNSGTNIAIESNWTSIQPRIRSAKISYIREVLPNDTYRSNLIPCKLLKPVPKWLDANGIRRQVGECGMIDLVSGKFYGNVNSSGTFTVENYYERKEWLCGDGSAYIDTDIIVNVTTLRYSLKFVHDTYNMAFLCGSRHSNTHEGDSTALVFDDIHNDKIRLDAIASGLLYSDIMLNKPNEVLIDCQTNSAIVNNSSIAGTRTEFNNSPYTFRIFDAYPKSTTTNTCTCKISYFTLNDSTNSLNLIPCTLTMDLPASMDANNIARTKGTSGMWDLVSDRFYGNVANSGTFKAVNLAEGVDYEVHQWLITENSNGDYMMSLPLNTYDFSLKRRILELDGNCYHFLERGNTLHYFTTPTYVTKVYEDGVPTFSSIAQTSFGDDIEIKSTNNSLTFNGEDVPIPDSYFTYLRFKKSVSGTIMKISTSSITVDGSVRYIPVKLLRSIPAKYDANGIARQAGECGMYDTVNDVFYGDVASSGSFTVSDDN